jgi:hypothetical protein
MQLESNMKTAVIPGLKLSQTDTQLSQILALPSAPDDPSYDGTVWFGVENEDGEIYRVVGAPNIVAFANTMRQLRREGFWVEPLEPQVVGDLFAVVKPTT